MRVTSLVITLVIMFMSMGIVSNAASNLPNDFFVIGNNVVGLTYAFSNPTEFNDILNDYLVGGGEISGLCAVIGGSYLPPGSEEPLDENEVAQLMAGVDTLIDEENPSGTEVELPPEFQAAKATVTANTLAFGTSKIFNVTVHSVTDLDDANGFYLGDKEDDVTPIGGNNSISLSADSLTVSIVNANNEVIGTFKLQDKEYSNEDVVVAKVNDNEQEIEYLQVITIE